MAARAITTAAALLLALFTTGTAGAVTAWNDVTSDFSNFRDNTTDVTFVPGKNEIIGQTGKAGTETDRDYFTFVIPSGYVLDALIVLESVVPAGNAAFLGLQSGSEVTVDPTAPDPGLLLGYWHFSPADALLDRDILPDIASRPDAQGFTPPLGPGTYSVWIQDTNLGASTYTLQFDVVLASGPATAFLTLAGFAGLAGMRLVGNRIGRRRTPVRDDR